MEKIALIRRNGLGDLLCTYPLILYLKKKFPHSALTLFLDKRNSPLQAYLPPVDKTIIIGEGNKYWSILKTMLRHRSDHFDLALSTKTSPMKLMNCALWTLGSQKSIAYVDARWHRCLVTNPIAYSPQKAKKLHQALKALHLVAPHFKTVPPALFPQITVPLSFKDKYPLPGKKPFVLLSASTTNASDRLHPLKYARLANHLTGVHILVIGFKQDLGRAQQITKNLKLPFTLYIPKNFEEFMVLLTKSTFYFVSNGGIAHIGAALNKKQVVLFGGTSPLQWAPLSSQAKIFYHPHHVDHLEEEEIITSLKKFSSSLQ